MTILILKLETLLQCVRFSTGSAVKPIYRGEHYMCFTVLGASPRHHFLLPLSVTTAALNLKAWVWSFRLLRIPAVGPCGSVSCRSWFGLVVWALKARFDKHHHWVNHQINAWSRQIHRRRAHLSNQETMLARITTSLDPEFSDSSDCVHHFASLGSGSTSTSIATTRSSIVGRCKMYH